MLSSNSYHLFVDILCHCSPLPSVGVVRDSFAATPMICTASPVDMELGSNYNGALSDSGPNASAKPNHGLVDGISHSIADSVVANSTATSAETPPSGSANGVAVPIVTADGLSDSGPNASAKLNHGLIDGISHSIADSVVANSTATSAEAPPSGSANGVAVPIATADAPPVMNAMTCSTSSLGAEITTSDAALSKPPTSGDLMDIEVGSIVAKSTRATATKILAYVTKGDRFFQSLKYSDAWIDLVYKWVLFEQSGVPPGVCFKVYFDSTLSYCISCRHFPLQIGQRR